MLLTALLGVLAVPAASINGSSVKAAAAPVRYEVTVINRSSYTIRSIYMSLSTSNSWGRDLLGNGVLEPGYQVKVNAEPGVWDMKVVDEDGDPCVAGRIVLNQDMVWTLTNANLLRCEGYR